MSDGFLFQRAEQAEEQFSDLFDMSEGAVDGYESEACSQEKLRFELGDRT